MNFKYCPERIEHFAHAQSVTDLLVSSHILLASPPDTA